MHCQGDSRSCWGRASLSLKTTDLNKDGRLARCYVTSEDDPEFAVTLSGSVCI